MSISHTSPSLIGLTLTLIGSISAGIQSLFGKLVATTTVDAETASTGLMVSIAVGVIGLMTQVVNGLFAGRKLRREVMQSLEDAKAEAIDAKAEADRKIADAKAEADRKIADAKAEADRKIADAKAESDRKHFQADQEATAKAADRKREREFENRELLVMKGQLREAQAQIRSLEPRIETAARGIDINRAAAQTLSDAIGVSITTSPKMDGGHGAMDPVPEVKPTLVGHKVVIIEDEAGSREMLAKEFRASGWDAVSVESGRDAIDRICSGSDCPDAFLVDLSLPGASGLDVIRLIRETKVLSSATHRPSRIVAYTGNDGDSAKQAAFDAGADAIVFKPCDFDRTLAVVAGLDPGDATPTPARDGQR